MTRRISIFKILSAVLAVLLLAVFFAGCGEYKPPESTGGGSAVTPPDDPTPPDVPDDDCYTVSLVLRDEIQETPFTNENYSLITKLQAQWTEITDGRAEVYRANFDKNGVAKVSGLAGDFNVTLILTEEFKKLYTYDPNPARPERRDELVATRYKKSVSVPMYRIKQLGERASIAILGGGSKNYYVLNETGAYSYTLKSRTDSQLFAYSPKKSGEYSFLTLMDVTADEVNPLIDMYAGMVGNFLFPVGEAENLGGAEGNYTKNIWLKYLLPEEMTGGSNCMAFNLYSESEKPDAYPLTIYFIFERDGEYTRPKIETVDVPVTEDFTKTPKTPDGVFEFASESPLFGNVRRGEKGNHILNRKKVKYNDPVNGGDGYYYFIDPETGDFFRETDGSVSAQYRVYAVITKTNPVLRGMAEGGGDASLVYDMLTPSYHWVLSDDGTMKDYYYFIVGSGGYSGHCNLDGAYPVNAELKQFLQDFAVSQRYFNDGNGHAEGMGVDSDESSQWLFACGIYVN